VENNGGEVVKVESSPQLRAGVTPLRYGMTGAHTLEKGAARGEQRLFCAKRKKSDAKILFILHFIIDF
jgi:hypothetical protein